MQLHEPATAITDYLLGAVSAALAVRLFLEWRKRRQRSVLFWGFALLAAAVASILGGTYHGLPQLLGPYGEQLWTATTWSIGVASFFLLSGSLLAAVRPPLNNVLIWLAGGKLLFYLFWMSRHSEFLYPILDYGSSMIIVLVLAIICRSQWGFRWIAVGIAVSILGSAVQQAHVAISPRFDHNALFHVIQMGSMALLFRGAMRLKDARLQEAPSR